MFSSLPCRSFRRKSVLFVRAGCRGAGGAAEGRSARSAARQGSARRDWGQSRREVTPNLLLFPPFIHHTGALWQFTLPWMSRTRRCPPRLEQVTAGCRISRLRFLFLGWILTLIPHLVLSAGPSGGVSCLHRRKDTAEKPPGTKERMQGPARKELYWHDPTGSSRHPHRPGCEPREGCPEIPAELPSKYLQNYPRWVQRGFPGTPSCCQCSQGHRSRGEALCAELQRETGPPALSPRAPPNLGQLCRCPEGWGSVSPIQKGLSFPSAKHLLGALGWAGMKGCGAASSCKEKGREERDGRRERR